MIAWYKLNTNPAPYPGLSPAPENKSSDAKTDTDSAVNPYNPNQPAGRASHSAVMCGSLLVVFGGLLINPADSQIVPSNDLYVLNTGLNIPPGASGYDSDSDPDSASDEEDGVGAGDSDGDGEGTGSGGNTLNSVGPHHRKGGAAAEEHVTEGWLASHELVSTSKSGDKWEWARNYFRLVNNELDQYEPKQKGAVSLTTDGCVKIWINKRLEAESTASGEYLLQSDAALETLLNAPATDKKLQEFLMFCKSIFSEENVSFALEVAGFKATHAGSADVAAIKADAKSIYEKYIGMNWGKWGCSGLRLVLTVLLCWD